MPKHNDEIENLEIKRNEDKTMSSISSRIANTAINTESKSSPSVNEIIWNQQKKTPVKKLPIPTHDRVVITKSTPETKTPSGIIIPAKVIGEGNRGIVVAVGPLVGKTIIDEINKVDILQFIPKEGDLVQFGEYAGVELPFNGETYLIMRESDILAIIPK